MNEEDLPPTSGDEAEAIARISAMLGPDDDAQEDAQQEQPPADDGEDVADDAPEQAEDDRSEAGDEAESQTSEDAGELEIVYKGKAEKVTLDEARTLAQLGKMYREREAEVTQHWQQAAQTLEQVQKVAQQATPELLQAQGMVALYDQALKQFDFESLRKLARDDPAAYLEKRAEIDQLQQQRQVAVERLQTLGQQVGGELQAARQKMLAAEQEMLPKLVPAWKDDAKFETAKKQLRDFLNERKVRPQTVAQIGDNAELMALAHDAMQWRAQQKVKMERVRGEAPKAQQKVLRPGAVQTKATLDADRTAKLRSQLRKTGDGNIAAKIIESML